MKKVAISLGIAFGVAALTVGLLWLSVLASRHRAHRVLRELSVIEAEKSNQSELELLANKGLIARSPVCTRVACTYTFQFDNRTLSWTRLTTTKVFKGEIGIANGTVRYSSLELMQDGGPVAVSDSVRQTPNGEPLYISHLVAGNGVPGNTLVYFTAQSTPSQRQLAFSFNLSVLTDLGTLHDGSRLLPAAWKTPFLP
jgi:hypothetical protein